MLMETDPESADQGCDPVILDWTEFINVKTTILISVGDFE